MNLSMPESCWGSWTIATDSACSSGYGTAANTPDSELFPVDWETLVDQLTAFEDETLIEEDVQQSLFLSSDSTSEFQTQTDCSFFISFKDRATSTRDLEELNIVIAGPSGTRYPVKNATRLSDQVVLTFRPAEPGAYVVSGFFRDVFHIRGSPTILYVSRNYLQQLTKPIVSFDVELDSAVHALPTEEPRLEFRKPWGLCCNTSTEQVLVADREQHEILVFGPDGDFNFRFGGEGQVPGKFYRPTGLAFDAVGNRILVSDKDNHRIQIFTADGEFLFTFGGEGRLPGQFLFPWGVAVSQDGFYIAVADSRNHRVQLFDSEGRYLRHFTLTTGRYCKNFKNKFDYPRGLAFSLTGDALYVTDFNLQTVFQLDIEMTSATALLPFGTLRRPSGITVDDVGNLIICDTKNNAVKILKPDGTLVGCLDKIGTSSLDTPLDVSLMRAGAFAVLDLNGRVRIV